MKAVCGVTFGDEKPRVLMVLNRFIPMVGGAERQCESLMTGLMGSVSWVGVLTYRYDSGLARRIGKAYRSGGWVFRLLDLLRCPGRFICP